MPIYNILLYLEQVKYGTITGMAPCAVGAGDALPHMPEHWHRLAKPFPTYHLIDLPPS